MVTLIELARTLIDHRAALVAELAAIETELAQTRQLLGLDVAAPVASKALTLDEAIARRVRHVDPKNAPLGQRICERCGTAFVPKAGNAGRFCSRACYETPKTVPPAAQPDEPPLLRAHDLPAALRPPVRVKPAPAEDDDLETVRRAVRRHRSRGTGWGRRWPMRSHSGFPARAEGGCDSTDRRTLAGEVLSTG